MSDKKEVLSVEEIKSLLEGKKSGGRKEEVLSILKKGWVKIEEIGKEVGIKNKNVSSVLSYLRSDGWVIEENSLGKKRVRYSKSDLENMLK